jgi:hypothetical protein
MHNIRIRDDRRAATAVDPLHQRQFRFGPADAAAPGEVRMPRNALVLAVGLIAAGVVALSIHVAMLYWVPFPTSQPTLWAKWLNQSIGVAGVLAFLRIAGSRIGDRSFPSRVLITFVIVAALRETLRVGIMNGVVTTGWAFSAILVVEPLVRALIVALFCVVAVRWVRSGPSLFLVALATGASCMAAQMLAGAVLGALPDHFSWLSRPDLYQFPYPMQVLIPAYLTMAEPVIAVAVMMALAWDGLPSSRAARLSLFALLVVTMKSMIGLTFVYSFFSERPVPLAMLSYSQFLFEAAALGFLAGLAWEVFGPRRRPSA